MAIHSKHKLLYVLKRYPRISETFILNELWELRRLGIQVVILAQKDPKEYVVHERVKLLDVPIYYLSSIQTAMIAPMIASLGITHIHAHFASWAAGCALSLNKLTGIPYSFTAHAKDVFHKDVDKKALIEKMRRATCVVAVSDFTKTYLKNLLPSARIIRIYNGVDVKSLSFDSSARKPHLVVGVSRLVEKKGFDDLVRACKILKDRRGDVRCIIIGEGDQREMLERLVRTLSLQKEVSLLGAKSHEEALALIRQAEVFVLPAKIGTDGNRDVLPTVLLEAMALGSPVVSIKITGIPEIITQGKTGILVEEKNAHALADAIENLFDSESARKRLALAARLKVEKDFNIEINVKMLLAHMLK